MKKIITKKELSHLYQNLSSPGIGLYRGVKFSHAVSRNKGGLESIFNSMVQECLFDDDVRKFVKKWEKLNSEDMISEMKKELEKDPSLNELIERASKKVRENVSLLNQQIEVELYMINMDNLPDDIRVHDYEALRLIIIEPEEKLPVSI